MYVYVYTCVCVWVFRVTGITFDVSAFEQLCSLQKPPGFSGNKLAGFLARAGRIRASVEGPVSCLQERLGRGRQEVSLASLPLAP